MHPSHLPDTQQSSKSNPPVRWAQVLEGHSGVEGAEWEEYEWAYMTTHERSPPRFVAPHHPRLLQRLRLVLVVTPMEVVQISRTLVVER